MSSDLDQDRERRLDFTPYSLPKAMLTAIGLVTTSAAQTEDLIQWAVAGSLGLDFEYGKAATLHMNMPLRLSVLRSAAEIRLDSLDALDELDDLIGEVERAFERRNAIVHHQWCRDEDTGEIFTSKEVARTSLRVELVPMSVATVEDAAKTIYLVGIKMYGFCKKYGLIPANPAARPRAHKLKEARKKRRADLKAKSEKSP
jgi:hypothetical protein